jgi:hypothetical protein
MSCEIARAVINLAYALVLRVLSLLSFQQTKNSKRSSTKESEGRDVVRDRPSRHQLGVRSCFASTFFAVLPTNQDARLSRRRALTCAVPTYHTAQGKVVRRCVYEKLPRAFQESWRGLARSRGTRHERPPFRTCRPPPVRQFGLVATQTKSWLFTRSANHLAERRPGSTAQYRASCWLVS